MSSSSAVVGTLDAADVTDRSLAASCVLQSLRPSGTAGLGSSRSTFNAFRRSAPGAHLPGPPIAPAGTRHRSTGSSAL